MSREVVTAATEAPSIDTAARQHAWRSRLTVDRAALALTLLPLLVGIGLLVFGVGGDFHPIHDMAQMELRIRDIGHHEVLVGPYSRGFYHPGPTLFYLLAVPYRLLGGASVGMYVGALMVNAASVAGMAWIARRRGGTPLMVITLLCSALLLRSLGPELVRDPWNPYVTVLPFGLMLFVSWAMACGDSWALPVGAGVATFLVQSHVGYLPLALPLLAWGVIWLGATSTARGLLRPAVVALGVAAVMWALPIYDQLSNEPGNMGETWQYFAQTEEDPHSLGDGARVLSTELGLDAEWLTGRRTEALSGEPTALYGTAPLPVLLAPLALAAVVLWRRGPGDARRLLLTLAVAFGLGMIAVARTTGLAFAYRLQWAHVLGMATGVVMLWGVVVAVERGSDREARQFQNLLVGGLVAALVVATAVNTVSAARAGTPWSDQSDAVAELTPAIEEALPPGDGPVLISPSSFAAAVYAPGFVLSLERRGYDVRVQPMANTVGSHRLYQGGPLRATVTVGVGLDIERLLENPDLQLVGMWGSIPEPRPDDDPVAAYEEAFTTGDDAAGEALARQTIDYVDELPRPFPLDSVAVFIDHSSS